MSLIISNRATIKQLDFLRELGYFGNTDLTQGQAARLIDELVEQRKQEAAAYEDQFSHDYIEYEDNYYDIF